MNSTVLTQAHNQWARRPDDERFTSLIEMREAAAMHRWNAVERRSVSRDIELVPEGRTGLQAVIGRDEAPVDLTHWSFGQLAGLSQGPAGYLRSLPAPLAADCVNYGLRFRRQPEDLLLLLEQNGGSSLRAATGPGYGRIYNADVIDGLISRFGDGVSGDWRVPGINGKALSEVTKENTTLYCGDRDMFVFLADEQRKLSVPNRRNGLKGEVSRGFFVWNSEVGSSSIGAAYFCFDEVCGNRFVWGVSDYKEVRMRHSLGAPARWLEEVAPVLARFSQASAEPIERAIVEAQARRLEDDVDAFLAARKFTRSEIDRAKLAHVAEEGRPIETVWDAVTGLTAAAKSITWQDERVALERKAGALLTA